MIRLQEVDVKLDDGRHLTIHLNELPGVGFEPEVLLPPEEGENWLVLHRGSPQPNAGDAYGWAIGEAKRYADVKKVAIAEIDNPCNTEFLPSADQACILVGLSLNVPLKVNGR